jgi:hypothetical protein
MESVLGFFGIGRAPPESDAEGPLPSSYVQHQREYTRPPSFSNYAEDPNMGFGARRGFTATLNYSLSRNRASGAEARKSLGFTTSFSPTRLWQVAWSTQYNITDREFESQVIRMAASSTSGVPANSPHPNSNFGFFFSIHLHRPARRQVRLQQNSFDN